MHGFLPSSCPALVEAALGPVSGRARTAGTILLLALAAQITLGIATLLMAVPVSLGAAHQGGAMGESWHPALAQSRITS